MYWLFFVRQSYKEFLHVACYGTACLAAVGDSTSIKDITWQSSMGSGVQSGIAIGLVLKKKKYIKEL